MLRQDASSRDIPWHSKVTIEGTHPLVRPLFKAMRERRVSIKELSVKSGVSRSAIQIWLSRGAPTVTNLEACLNVVGLQLQVAPLDAGHGRFCDFDLAEPPYGVGRIDQEAW